MKKYGVLLAIFALVFASLACQTVMGGSDQTELELPAPSVDDEQEVPAASPEASGDSDYSFGGDSEFPMPDDAFNVVNVAGVTNYQTNLSVDEALAFYRDVFGKQGFTERDLLTTTTDGVFSIVFDGHESGQAIVVQGVDLGDGSVNINISLQDI